VQLIAVFVQSLTSWIYCQGFLEKADPSPSAQDDMKKEKRGTACD
jgi:hypothetical protein